MTAPSRVALTVCLTGALVGVPSLAFAAGAPAEAEPRGNNGTIKINEVPISDGRANDPHVGCTFALRFFGFDEGQTADIAFTGQAPTKLGTLLEQKAVAISDDAAGGGQDTDAALTYTATQLGLTHQPQGPQGWHVKVAVDVLEAPGGAKQKVFWLQCPAQTSGTTTPPANSGTTTAGTTTPLVTGGTETGGGGAVTSPVTRSTSPQAAVAGTTATAPTFGSGTVTGAVTAPGTGRGTSAGGAALPLTGLDASGLAQIALGALGLGGLALVAGRRRRTASVG